MFWVDPCEDSEGGKCVLFKHNLSLQSVGVAILGLGKKMCRIQ